MNESKNQQDLIDSTAASWVVRLGGGSINDLERRELDEWLAESPAHAYAFEEARTAWTKMGELQFTSHAKVPDIIAPSASADPIVAKPKHGHARRNIWAQVAALATCLIILTGAALVWLDDPSVLLAADHRTVPGEQKRIALSDGSAVELGPASAIAVRYSDTERHVELLRGLALFDVAPQGARDHRPFVVSSKEGIVRALGTRFLVEHVTSATEVTVIEHTVEVALRPSSGKRPHVVVESGRAVRYVDSHFDSVRSVNLGHALAWRRGRLIVDRMPLREVVGVLNRYRRGRIVVARPALASRTVSGVFDLTNPDAALATIIRDLRIEATSLPPLLTVLY